MAETPDVTLRAKPVCDHILQQLAEQFPRHCAGAQIGRMFWKESVPDNPVKCEIRSQNGHAVAIGLISRDSTPTDMAHLVENIDQARSVLPAHLTAPVLAPLVSGWAHGASYAVFPFCRPLTTNRYGWVLQRRVLRMRLVRWLQEVALASRRPLCDSRRREFVFRPLEYLMECSLLSGEARRRAEQALYRARTGAWNPSGHVSHNDLWKDNVLLAPRQSPFLGENQHGFVLIDWGAACEYGQPIFDLIRAAQSLRVPGPRLRTTVADYRRALGLDHADCQGALLVSLGWVGMRGAHFPRDRHAALTESCLSVLAGAMAQ